MPDPHQTDLVFQKLQSFLQLFVFFSQSILKLFTHGFFLESVSFEQISLLRQVLFNHVRNLLLLQWLLLPGNWLESCNDLGIFIVERLAFERLICVHFFHCKVVLSWLLVFLIDVVQFLNSILELFRDIFNLLEQHWILLVDHLQVVLALCQIGLQLVDDF